MSGETRDQLQVKIYAWATDAFGADQMVVKQRAVRLLEEAIEAYQACGAPREMAHKLVDYVFERPIGELGQELGGIGVALLALAQAAGLSAETSERTEVTRVLGIPIDHFTRRNQAKNAAGFLAIEPGPNAERDG